MMRDEGIAHVTGHSEKTEIQPDGRIRKWAWIPEARMFLQVILIEDFEAGEHKRIAVKIVDDRGIEGLKVMEIE